MIRTELVPTRIREFIGGMDGTRLETFGQFTKLIKGDLEVLILPPRTCIVLKRSNEGRGQDRVSLFPNLSIASHHVGLLDNDLLLARKTTKP